MSSVDLSRAGTKEAHPTRHGLFVPPGAADTLRPRPNENEPMESASIERRLAAILAADVVGYSRLMEVDEDGHACAPQDASARADRPGHRQEPRPHHQDHRRRHAGRVPERHRRGPMRGGDPAPHGAAQCRRLACPQHRVPHRHQSRRRHRRGRRHFRRRRQRRGAAGRRWRSRAASACRRAVRDQVGDRLDVGFEDLGEQSVKNISAADPRLPRAARQRDGGRARSAPAVPQKAAGASRRSPCCPSST